MPQMNKGGKFIFGISMIRADGSVYLPTQAIEEYDILSEGEIILFTGSRSTGGFCVSRCGLFAQSLLSHILSDNPMLAEHSLPEGTFVKYKGRSYCRLSVSANGRLVLTEEMLGFLHLNAGDELLAIRSSDIAFTMGAKGVLIERAHEYGGIIPRF